LTYSEYIAHSEYRDEACHYVGKEEYFIKMAMTHKAALITGAAAGLGRATALKLAKAGADICLVDINASGLAAAAAEVRALGVKALVHESDLSVAENCPAVVAACVAAFGRLDALCNVAGVLMPGDSAQMPAADFQKTLAVNLAAPFYLIQAAIPHLLQTNGAVVNVTSALALKAQAYSAAYCATKAALTHMTKALAMEYMHKPIRFNAVAPGGMMTGITAGMVKLRDVDFTLLKRAAPLRGMVEIDDVAEMVAFLASDAARGYHGACIVIDAGLTAD
jgi:NAD(P)-dependent dehydrogenase (short-subunit alcohol dehydrogenase family)